jgi:hypothetical protein
MKKKLEKQITGEALWANILLYPVYRPQGLPDRGSLRWDEKIKDQFRLIHHNMRKLSTPSEGKEVILPEKSILFQAYFSYQNSRASKVPQYYNILKNYLGCQGVLPKFGR